MSRRPAGALASGSTTCIEEACRRYAERTAVATESENLSYAIDARANQMARLFIRKGVRPGDRVAALLDRGPESYVALFALLKARAAYVPLTSMIPPSAFDTSSPTPAPR